MLFRGLDMADEDQLAFTNSLGPMGDKEWARSTRSRRTRKEPQLLSLHPRQFSWHIDRTDTDVPPYITMLVAKRLAPVDGDTEFANTYAAYDALPDHDKRLIEGLKVVHRVSASFRYRAGSQRRDARAPGNSPRTRNIRWSGTTVTAASR